MKNNQGKWIWTRSFSQADFDGDNIVNLDGFDYKNFGYGGLGKVRMESESMINGKIDFAIANLQRDAGVLGFSFKGGVMDLAEFNLGSKGGQPNNYVKLFNDENNINTGTIGAEVELLVDIGYFRNIYFDNEGKSLEEIEQLGGFLYSTKKDKSIGLGMARVHLYKHSKKEVFIGLHAEENFGFATILGFNLKVAANNYIHWEF